jgi:hypothetical protein
MPLLTDTHYIPSLENYSSQSRQNVQPTANNERPPTIQPAVMNERSMSLVEFVSHSVAVQAQQAHWNPRTNEAGISVCLRVEFGVNEPIVFIDSNLPPVEEILLHEIEEPVEYHDGPNSRNQLRGQQGVQPLPWSNYGHRIWTFFRPRTRRLRHTAATIGH